MPPALQTFEDFSTGQNYSGFWAQVQEERSFFRRVRVSLVTKPHCQISQVFSGNDDDDDDV